MSDVRPQQHIYASLKTTLSLQVLVCCAALPFIMWWHMTFTPLSFLGNVLYPFFLIGFLALSSIVSAATLLNLCPSFLYSALALIQKGWTMLLDIPGSTWWLHLNWWHLAPATIIGMGMWMSITTRKTTVTSRSLLLVGSLLCVCICVYPTTYEQTMLIRGGNTLTFTPQYDGSIELYDAGYISKAGNIDALIDYEVVPHLLWHYGHVKKVLLKNRARGVRYAMARSALAQWSLSL